MEYNEQKQERVILAGVHRGMRDALWDTTEESIHELGIGENGRRYCCG